MFPQFFFFYFLFLGTGPPSCPIRVAAHNMRISIVFEMANGTNGKGTPAKTAVTEQTLVKSMIAFCFAMAIKSNLIRNKLFQSTGRLCMRACVRACARPRTYRTLVHGHQLDWAWVLCMCLCACPLTWPWSGLRDENNIVFDCLFVRAKINECCGWDETNHQTKRKEATTNRTSKREKNENECDAASLRHTLCADHRRPMVAREREPTAIYALDRVVRISVMEPKKKKRGISHAAAARSLVNR